jgi:hypothetical protein
MSGKTRKNGVESALHSDMRRTMHDGIPLKNRRLEAALRYASRGMPVLPVHGFKDGQCTCGNDCQNPGKHPRTRRGVKDATTDQRQIEQWWSRWPAASVGIATGRSSGLLVLDIDADKGGYESLEELLAGETRPLTPTVRTGGGGLHLYFKPASHIKARNRISIMPGLDTKADGGFVVAPPSLHKSGGRYQWLPGLAPWDVELAPIPRWLSDLLSKSKRRKLTDRPVESEPILEGKRHDSLLRMAGALRRQGATPEDIKDALLVLNDRRCNPPLPEQEICDIAQSAGNWEPGIGGCPYFATEEGIFWNKITSNDLVPVRLTNFNALINTDIVEDDRVEMKRSCEIEAKLFGKTKRFTIPSANFMTMSWPFEMLGAKAVVSPTMGLRDHARAAIQELSATSVEERKVLTHAGWAKHREKNVYLHCDGAIGEEGEIVDIRVQLPSRLAHLKLPLPSDEESLRRAVRASLKFLDIGSPSVMYPIYAGIWRATLGSCHFSEHVAGETGVGKTVVAALAQQHFGAGFNQDNLPGSWSSTGNANEGLAFTAKDMLFGLDDFTPTGTRGDVARSNKDADRIFRAQGNSSGRARMKSDSSLRDPKPPRGLILSTGEDIPRGRSLRARVFILLTFRQ